VKGLTIHSVSITEVVSLDWDAERWELYTGHSLAEVAARQLNRAFIQAVRDGPDRNATRKVMHLMMARYASVGAADTEPRGHLEDLLDAVYGTG
jgi:hypothetical protein